MNNILHLICNMLYEMCESVAKKANNDTLNASYSDLDLFNGSLHEAVENSKSIQAGKR